MALATLLKPNVRRRAREVRKQAPQVLTGLAPEGGLPLKSIRSQSRLTAGRTHRHHGHAHPA